MESWNFFTAKELRPSGWLRRQLEIQATGLCGNLDKVWPDVRDSAWIGGSAEGWERVPYWLDGFLPLAYLLSIAGFNKKGNFQQKKSSAFLFCDFFTKSQKKC